MCIFNPRVCLHLLICVSASLWLCVYGVAERRDCSSMININAMSKCIVRGKMREFYSKNKKFSMKWSHASFLMEGKT